MKMEQPGRIIALLFLGALAAAACESGKAGARGGSGGAHGGAGTSGTGDTTTTSIPDPISEPEFKSLLAELACSAEAPCCEPAGYRYNEAACHEVVSALWKTSPANTIFDSASAVDCLKVLQTKPACGSGDTACKTVYRGTLPPGAACQEDAECSSSENLVARCEVNDKVCTTTSQGQLGDVCDQTCTAAAEGVATCFTVFMGKVYPVTPYAHVACDRAQGLFCDTSINKCAALKAAGDSCTGPSDCTVGMNCIVSGTKGACQPRPTVGQPCPVSEGTAFCAFDATCGADQICQAKKAAGQSCKVSDECLGVCTSGLCVGSSQTEAIANAFTGLTCGGQKL